MKNRRSIVERRHIDRDPAFDEQFWPIVIALSVLAAMALGAMVSLLRGPWLWASLLLLPLGIAIVMACLWFVDNRRLKRSIQLGLILSCAAHLLILLVASVLQVFGQPIPDTDVVAQRPVERTVTIRNRTVPFVWQRSSQKETPEIELETPRTSTSEAMRPVEVSVEDARPTVQPQTQPRRETEPAVPRRDREMARLKRSRPRPRPAVSEMTRSAPSSVPTTADTSEVPRSATQPDRAVETTRAAPETESPVALSDPPSQRAASSSAVSPTPAARRADRAAASEPLAASDATARIRRSQPRLPRETTLESSMPVETARPQRSTAPSTASLEGSTELNRKAAPTPSPTPAAAAPVQAPSKMQTSITSRRADHAQPPNLSRADAQANAPRRSMAVAARPVSPDPVEAPRPRAADEANSLQPVPRALAIDRGTEGTAGVGASRNLESAGQGPVSPAARASASASRRTTRRRDDLTMSLTNQMASQTGRRTPRDQRPQTAVPVDVQTPTRRAASTRPALESTLASASRVDSNAKASPDDRAMQQGQASVESGATKIVTEVMATRRGGGGAPVLQVAEESSAPSSGRVASDRRPTIDADAGAVAAAPSEPTARPAAATIPGPAQAADVIDRNQVASSMEPGETKSNASSEPPTASEPADLAPAARRRSRTDQTEIANVAADNPGDTTALGNRENRFARAPTLAPDIVAGQASDSDGNAPGKSPSSNRVALERTVDAKRSATADSSHEDLSPVQGAEASRRTESRSVASTSRREVSNADSLGLIDDRDALAGQRDDRGRRRSRNATPKLEPSRDSMADAAPPGPAMADSNSVASSSVDRVDQTRQSDFRFDDDGDRMLDVEAEVGQPGLADQPTMRMGVPDRPASKQSDLLALDSPTRFRRRDTAARPTVAPAAAIASEGFRTRDPMTVARGEPITEEAIHAGLEFLARHQRPDGSWTLVDFDREQPLHVYQIDSDAAATGLALLAFQGAGYHHQEFKYAERLQAAIDWLVSHQDPQGCLFVPSDPDSNNSARMYSHAIATLALAEAYGMTRDPELRQPVERALTYMQMTQDPRRGGWRYFGDPDRRSTDTSVTGWMMMAIKSGQLAGLTVSDQLYEGIDKWMAMARDVDAPYRFRYNPFARDGSGIVREQARVASQSMTAVGLLMRVYSGWRRADERFQLGAESLLKQLPGDEDSRVRDTYYWYYATQVLKHAGGDKWERWNARLHPLLIESQVKTGPLAGSWDPYRPVPDRWGPHGGRLYVTTLNLLSLEVQYRLLPLYEETVQGAE